MVVAWSAYVEWVKRPVGLATFLAVIVLLLNIGASLFVVAGQNRDIDFLEERLQALKGEALPDKVDPSYAIGMLLEDVATFKKRLPSADALSRVIDDVYVSARRNGLSIEKGIYTPKSVNEMEISRYSISFPVQGRYKDIKKFIYDLETLKHPLVLDEISLARSKGGRGIVELNIMVSTYFL